jgi:hypothetical protein
MVTQLFDDRYAPITSEIGFLECGAKIAAEAYATWMRPIHAEISVAIETSEVHSDFVSKIRALLPLTSVQRRRTLFLPTQSRWTAYFDNGWRGTDSYSAVSYLCQTIGCQGIRAVSIPNTIRKTTAGTCGRYGATILELYAASTDGCSFLNTRRSVHAANDGGRWNFGTHGEPLEFEELAQYEARRIQERFTADMLDRYLGHWGIQFFSPEFYEVPEPAMLVSKIGPNAANLKAYSLEEARADY